MADEIYYKLSATIDGVVSYSGSDAKLSEVAEWLDTPKGEISGAPHWGNDLSQYRHMPMNGDTAAAIENHIALELPADVPDVSLSSIRVDPVTIDRWDIKIYLMGVTTPVNRTINL